MAISLLGELDERFSEGPLAEERRVTKVLALCTTGEVGAAAELARPLLDGSPGSIYATRLERSCASSVKRAP